MNNILIGLKRFAMNKNTVTVVAVIAILGLLYWGYTTQINSSVSPISVPVARVTINPRTEITSDMLSSIAVPKIAITDNVIRSNAQVIGKYTNINVTIPAGSMFFKGKKKKKSALGNKIDIYMKAVDDNGQIMVGRLLENVEVLAVKDTAGRNVFENATETRTPAYLIFGVPERIHILLRKAEYLRNIGVELFPVPHGGTVPVVGDMQVDIMELQNYIDARTVNLLPADLETANTEASAE